MSTKKKAEKILQEPEELERLMAIRQKLVGTDRDDHLSELDAVEKQIKKALIFLNLQGHEGIQQLLTKAREEIRDINRILMVQKPVSMGVASQFAYETHLLHARREMWAWFMNLFTEAEDSIKNVRGFLDLQEEDEPAPQEYMGTGGVRETEAD